jgi:hypothetical protein
LPVYLHRKIVSKSANERAVSLQNKALNELNFKLIMPELDSHIPVIVLQSIITSYSFIDSQYLDNAKQEMLKVKIPALENKDSSEWDDYNKALKKIIINQANQANSSFMMKFYMDHSDAFNALGVGLLVAALVVATTLTWGVAAGVATGFAIDCGAFAGGTFFAASKCKSTDYNKLDDPLLNAPNLDSKPLN